MQEKKTKSEESSENSSPPGSSSNKSGDSSKLRVKRGDDRDERGSNSRRGSEGSGGKAPSVHWKGDSSGE